MGRAVLEPQPPNLLAIAAGCSGCPRGPWCTRSLGGICSVPSDPDENVRFWEEQGRIVGRLGGVGPRALPPAVNLPELPPIVHVHVNQGPEAPTSWPWPIGVYAKDVIRLGIAGRPPSVRYLRGRGLENARKALIISGTDPWLARFCRGLGPPFFEGVARSDFDAVICPNLSAYHHAEHRVGLDNRAIVQLFMGACLSRGLPAVFHSYLEDAPEHPRWLVEYFRLNPTQQFIATGFDRGGANRREFVRRRLAILGRAQQSLGRPLTVVLSNILTRIWAVREASEIFPGRVHLLGQSVFLRAVKGSVLTYRAGALRWREDAREHPRGVELFLRNARVLHEAIADQAPSFYAGREVCLTGVTRAP
jgi:hypothetical protein